VKAGVMAVQENSLTDNKIILMINDFNSSDKRHWMTTGQRYYEGENDIFKKKNNWDCQR